MIDNYFYFKNWQIHVSLMLNCFIVHTNVGLAEIVLQKSLYSPYKTGFW